MARRTLSLLDLILLRDQLYAQLRDVNDLIDECWETGPENSREEVSPSGRSPQRDCRVARVAPAYPQMF